MKFMLSKQASDGSFVHHYLMSVVQVIPALIGAIPEDIKHIQCPVSPTDKQVAVSRSHSSVWNTIAHA